MFFLSMEKKHRRTNPKPKDEINRIKAVLAEKNIFSKELSHYLGKTESTVSRWCTNDVQPSVEMLYEIAKLLKVNIRDLLVSTKR